MFYFNNNKSNIKYGITGNCKYCKTDGYHFHNKVEQCGKLSRMKGKNRGEGEVMCKICMNTKLTDKNFNFFSFHGHEHQ